MKHTHEKNLGNTSYSRTRVYEHRFAYLDSTDRYTLAAPEPKYTLAVIGAGLMGQAHMESAYIEGRSKIGGLYDPHQGSIDTSLRICTKYAGEPPKVYSSLREAAADSSIDGYIIAAPNNVHGSLLELLMEAGKPIFLEKPMTTTPEEAARMVSLVRESDIPVQVGLQYRYKPVYVESADQVFRRSALGEVKTIGIREHRIAFLDKVGQWNKFRKFSGGTLVEKCCHYFDLFNLFAQSRPVRVIATGSQAASYKDYSYKGENPDILDNAYVIVEYENEVRAFLDLCMFVPMFFEELVICGTGGRLRAYEQEDFLEQESFRTGLELHRGEYHPSYTSNPKYPGIIGTMGHSGADFFSQAAFIDLIEGDKRSAPTVEEGYWSVVVGAAAEESVRTGAPVEIAQYLEKKKAHL